ncbi:MAG: hypothetical protein WBD20_12360 [Pirellulaceae bacterium]
MNSKRTKRRAIAVLATCFSTSCVLIAGAPSLFGETQANPFVTQGTAKVSPSTNVTEKVAEATPLSKGIVQENRLNLRSDKPRPTRLPDVASHPKEVLAIDAAPTKRPQPLPPIKLPPAKQSSVEMPSLETVSPKLPVTTERLSIVQPADPTVSEKASHDTSSDKVASSTQLETPSLTQALKSPAKSLEVPTKRINASDYELPEFDQAGKTLQNEPQLAQKTNLDLLPPAKGPTVVKPNAASLKSKQGDIVLHDPETSAVELAAPQVSLSPRVDPRRPIRPVEISTRSTRSTEPTEKANFAANQSATTNATATQSIGMTPRPTSPGMSFPTIENTQVANTASVHSPVTAKNWLPSTTSTSSQQDAKRFLDQAMNEYTRKAWASAEASAWESLTCSAEGIDIARRDASFGTNRAESSALDDLQLARAAIRESRDFAGKYGPLDSDAVKRIVLSHTTEVLKNQSLQNVPPIDATDRYLNEARVRLAPLAKYRVEAAQALDLLAAIHLGRNDQQRLPSQTALCFRRAALQGQPGNGSLAGRLGMHLASLGLDKEATWALQHAIAIEPTAEVAKALDLVSGREGDRTAALRLAAQMQSRLPAGYEQNRGPVPTVVQLTPRQFAAASKSQLAPKQSTPQSQAGSGSTQPPIHLNANHTVSNDDQSAPVSIRQTAAIATGPSNSLHSTATVNHASASDDFDGDGQPMSEDPAYFKTSKPKSKVRKMMDSVKFWQ